jgi:hypothetical protein
MILYVWGLERETFESIFPSTKILALVSSQELSIANNVTEGIKFTNEEF